MQGGRNEELEVRDQVGARTMARVGRVMATQRALNSTVGFLLHPRHIICLASFPLQAMLFNLLLHRKELKQKF